MPGAATSNSVSRGLALIELGALDEDSVEALADRLGLGERQLRRLFHQHLGATPIAVAQTRRVHLAKQLLHETSLPMAEIAFASGFGSIRRFNETFLALFGRAPGELRRAIKPEVSAGAQGEISLLLRYQPPYDWPFMLEFLRRRAMPGIELVTGDSYMRSIQLEGIQGTVSVQQADGHALRAMIRFPRLSALPVIIAAAAACVRSGCRYRGHPRASGTRPCAGTFDRGTARVAHAGGMGRIRASDTRGIGATGHRECRRQAGRTPGCRLRGEVD